LIFKGVREDKRSIENKKSIKKNIAEPAGLDLDRALAEAIFD